jgi:hypothetical protein
MFDTAEEARNLLGITCPGEYDLLQEIMPGYIRLPYNVARASRLQKPS